MHNHWVTQEHKTNSILYTDIWTFVHFWQSRKVTFVLFLSWTQRPIFNSRQTIAVAEYTAAALGTCGPHKQLANSKIITRGHAVDLQAFYGKTKWLTPDLSQFFSPWCEQNISQLHTFRWIMLLTLTEIQHLSYKHLWSECDHRFILSVTGLDPRGRKSRHICSRPWLLWTMLTHSGLQWQMVSKGAGFKFGEWFPAECWQRCI